MFENVSHTCEHGLLQYTGKEYRDEAVTFISGLTEFYESLPDVLRRGITNYIDLFYMYSIREELKEYIEQNNKPHSPMMCDDLLSLGFLPIKKSQWRCDVIDRRYIIVYSQPENTIQFVSGNLITLHSHSGVLSNPNIWDRQEFAKAISTSIRHIPSIHLELREVLNAMVIEIRRC